MAAGGHFEKNKACVSRNCNTNARIKFIIDTAIDDLEWKNPIDFGANRKNQNGRRRPFCENMMNKRPPGLIAPLLKFCNLLGNPPINTTKGRDLIFNEGIRLLNMADNI